ncbi:MAG TPA: hypothetical protein VH247_10980 [Thermoleophilaceae bacterium]|jgi:hypothetical protein|nr:hypothetical protein [Thermoleophilaceae bacterium]
MRPVLGTLFVLVVLALAACGSSKVDTATYTCGDFNKSLRTKGDDTSGTYINALRKEADLGQDTKTEQREITLGIISTCRGKPASTKPGDDAIKVAKVIKARAEKPGSGAQKKKKSSK